MSFDLRLTIREWVHLLTRGHFRHVTKMAVTPFDLPSSTTLHQNSTLHAEFMAVCFIVAALLLIDILHCTKRDFQHFCSCHLDLDPMTFIYKLDARILSRYTGFANMNFLRQGFRKLSSDTHTDRQRDRQDRHLRSARRHQLLVPRVRRGTFGARAFSVAGPTVWNSLPDCLRDPAVDSEQFRRDLKTYLFAGHSRR